MLAISYLAYPQVWLAATGEMVWLLRVVERLAR
jgi:hypothetical protein